METILSLKKCSFTQSLKHLKYLIVGFRSKQRQYVELNHILTTIGYAIYKGYCISENRKKYLDLLRLTKTEFQKSFEVAKSLKLKQSKLFLSFIKYFVQDEQ